MLLSHLHSIVSFNFRCCISFSLSLSLYLCPQGQEYLSFLQHISEVTACSLHLQWTLWNTLHSFRSHWISYFAASRFFHLFSLLSRSLSWHHIHIERSKVSTQTVSPCVGVKLCSFLSFSPLCMCSLLLDKCSQGNRSMCSNRHLCVPRTVYSSAVDLSILSLSLSFSHSQPRYFFLYLCVSNISHHSHLYLRAVDPRVSSSPVWDFFSWVTLSNFLSILTCFQMWRILMQISLHTIVPCTSHLTEYSMWG